jgi:hypothetical protein
LSFVVRIVITIGVSLMIFENVRKALEDIVSIEEKVYFSLYSNFKFSMYINYSLVTQSLIIKQFRTFPTPTPDLELSRWCVKILLSSSRVSETWYEPGLGRACFHDCYVIQISQLAVFSLFPSRCRMIYFLLFIHCTSTRMVLQDTKICNFIPSSRRKSGCFIKQRNTLSSQISVIFTRSCPNSPAPKFCGPTHSQERPVLMFCLPVWLYYIDTSATSTASTIGTSAGIAALPVYLNAYF